MEPSRMKLLRKMVGLRGWEVAKALEVDLSTVQRWESGKSKIKGMAEDAFLRLVTSPETVDAIKKARPKIVRPKPKNIVSLPQGPDATSDTST